MRQGCFSPYHAVDFGDAVTSVAFDEVYASTVRWNMKVTASQCLETSSDYNYLQAH
jgi:hypothetical protein